MPKSLAALDSFMKLFSGASSGLCASNSGPGGNPDFKRDLLMTPAATMSPSVDSAIKVGILPLFSTWIYQCDKGPVHLNEPLEHLAAQLRMDPRNATRRTNAGGWHYAFDLFELKEPVVEQFRNVMEQHVQAFLNRFRSPERKKKDKFLLRGWINVNRAGDFNTLHSHPGCFLSATYYVKVPSPLRGGEDRKSTRP